MLDFTRLELTLLIRIWNISVQVLCLLYHIINNREKGIALVNIILITGRERCLPGSGVSKYEEATGLI